MLPSQAQVTGQGVAQLQGGGHADFRHQGVDIAAADAQCCRSAGLGKTVDFHIGVMQVGEGLQQELPGLDRFKRTDRQVPDITLGIAFDDAKTSVAAGVEVGAAVAQITLKVELRCQLVGSIGMDTVRLGLSAARHAGEVRIGGGIADGDAQLGSVIQIGICAGNEGIGRAVVTIGSGAVIIVATGIDTTDKEAHIALIGRCGATAGGAHGVDHFRRQHDVGIGIVDDIDVVAGEAVAADVRQAIQNNAPHIAAVGRRRLQHLVYLILRQLLVLSVTADLLAHLLQFAVT